MNIIDILENKDFLNFIAYIHNINNFSSICKAINKNEKYKNFIIENTLYIPNDKSISYRLKMLKYDIFTYEDLPRCKNCKKILEEKDLYKFFGGAKSVFCSHECYSSYPKSEEYIDSCSTRMKKIWENRDETYKENFYAKVEATNMSKYGTKCTLNTQENICKKKATWLKNLGSENPFSSNIIKEKIKNTNILKYGSTCPLNNPEIKEKSKKTLYENYGVDNPMKAKIIVDKMRENAKLKYGVVWVSKSDEVWKKMCATYQNNLKIPKYKKYHIYKFNSGKEIIVLGYEDIALDFYILKKYNENDIENSIKYMNKLNIKYADINNNLHHYIPDFYIKSENLIIEVKSAFTFYTDLDTISRKCKACIEQGYNIIVIVFEHIDRKKLNIKYKIYNYENIEIEKEKYYK